MKAFITSLVIVISLGLSGYAQERASNEQHIGTLVIDKKNREVFRHRDSTMVIHIDTLVMKDRSTLEFFGIKDVKLVVKHAEIGKRAVITGLGSQNNASNFDIEINLSKLGSLYVMAGGRDAQNGFRTHPNGDGGNVHFRYNMTGVAPQSENRNGKNYLHIDVEAGGYHVVPVADIRIIKSQIAMSHPGLRGMPQGQVYSGSPGRDGKKTVEQL